MSRYDDALRHMAFMDSLGLNAKGYPKNDNVEDEDEEPVRAGVPVRDYDSSGNPQILVQADENDL